MGFKDILGSLAPLLGTAIGGPFGAIAVSLIQKHTGMNTESPEALELELNKLTPEAVEALKLAEIDFKKFMDDNEIKRDELTVKSQDSARKMAMATHLAPQIALSVIYNIGYFGLLYTYMIVMPKLGIVLASDVQAVVNILIGILTAEIPRINAFWFGSSFGSKMKDKKGE